MLSFKVVCGGHVAQEPKAQVFARFSGPSVFARARLVSGRGGGPPYPASSRLWRWGPD